MKMLADPHKLLPALWKGLEAERRGMGLVFRALIPIDEKEAYLDYGFSSLHVFLVKYCGFSDGAAFRRTHCVTLIRQHPKLLDAIESGTINLSNLTLVRNIINHDNLDATIQLIAGKSNREVEKIVAILDPEARPKSGTRKLRAGTGRHRTEPMTPIDGDLYKFIAVFGSALHARIERLYEKMKRQNPSNDPDVLFEAAITALEKEIEKKCFAKTDRPRKAKPSKDPGHISNATKRIVYERDGGQCTFVSKSEVRCSSREFLEYHHVDPRAHGGLGSPDNIRLLCSAHHKQETVKTFGRDHVKKKVASLKKQKATSTTDEKPASPAGSGGERKIAAPTPKTSAPKQPPVRERNSGS